MRILAGTTHTRYLHSVTIYTLLQYILCCGIPRYIHFATVVYTLPRYIYTLLQTRPRYHTGHTNPATNTPSLSRPPPSQGLQASASRLDGPHRHSQCPPLRRFLHRYRAVHPPRPPHPPRCRLHVCLYPPPLSLVPLLTPFARESAATLEAESGYSMESPQVSQFRRYVLSGLWSKAEALLACLFPDNDDGLCVCLSPPSPPSGSTHHSQDARFLISQQKYLELLEARKTTAALHVLRNELAPINTETQQLHTLSRSFSFLLQGASCPC